MPFTETAQVTLDANGDGIIRFGQVPQYRTRSYIRVTVSIDTGEVSALTGGEARMYAGDPIPNNFLTGTRTPWLDTSTFAKDASLLHHPLQLAVQFTNCDPGALATVTCTYTETRQGVSI